MRATTNGKLELGAMPALALYARAAIFEEPEDKDLRTLQPRSEVWIP